MKHIVLSVVGLLVLSSLSVSVYAKTAIEEREEIRQVRADVRATIAPLREAAKEQRKENVTERCAKVTENIDKRIAKFESDHNGRVKVFMTIKERVQERITKLKARGIDVTRLEANLVTLQTKIDKLTTDHTAYMEKLKATKAFVCGQSQGEFKAALEAARDAQKVVFADAKDIIAFIKDTLKPNLEALKALITPPAKVTPTAEPIE